MKKSYIDLPGWEWDTDAGRWISPRYSPPKPPTNERRVKVEPTPEPTPASDPREVLSIWKDQPGLLFYRHKQLLLADGYERIQNDPKIKRMESFVADLLTRFLKKEVEWLEYEDAICDWFFRSNDLLEVKTLPKPEEVAVVEKPKAEPPKHIKEMLEKVLRHFPETRIFSGC